MFVYSLCQQDRSRTEEIHLIIRWCPWHHYITYRHVLTWQIWRTCQSRVIL